MKEETEFEVVFEGGGGLVQAGTKKQRQRENCSKKQG